MKIILIQDLKSLGKKGDIKEVSDGYARNFLIPNKLVKLASKKNLEYVLQANREDFASLQNLVLKDLFHASLWSHEGLLGILLGYGRTNAWLFYEHKQPLKPVFSDELTQLFSSKKAVLNFTFGWPHAEMQEVLMFPNFMADLNAEETKRLKSDYLQTREKILNYYSGKNFLEATLQLLLTDTCYQ